MGATVAQAESHGVDWELRLERDDLLPGTTAKGRVALTAPDGIAGRGIVVALVATEQWRYRETYTDSQGHVQTRTVTKTEELAVWVGRLAGEGRFGGASRTIPFRADIPALYLPTIELPHGRTDATCHVILARAWARDPHLVRDVAICSTTEI